MDYKLKRVMSKIENGNIQSAHIYELVDTYYQCVIYKIDEYDDDDRAVSHRNYRPRHDR